MTIHPDVVLVVLNGINLDVTLHENLGVAYLATNLRKHGINTKILDAPSMELQDKEVLNYILNTRLRFVGFSTVFSNIESSLDMARILKDTLSEVTIAIGGSQTLTTAPEILKHEPQVDIVFVGEAEYSIVYAVKHILAGLSPHELELIGVVHRSNIHLCVGVVLTKNIEVQFPARDVQQFRQEHNYFPIAFLLASRGCYSNCSFCSDPTISKLSNGQKWRERAVDSVLDEIEELVKTFSIKYIIFSDDDFIGH